MDRQMDIYDLLYRLGVTANYTGFFHIALGVQLCMERPERLLLVTKCLYPDIARRYRTSWKAVERNIRAVGALVWERNRPLLEQLAGYPLTGRPSSAQLLAILTYSLLSRCAGPPPAEQSEPDGAELEGGPFPLPRAGKKRSV